MNNTITITAKDNGHSEKHTWKNGKSYLLKTTEQIASLVSEEGILYFPITHAADILEFFNVPNKRVEREQAIIIMATASTHLKEHTWTKLQEYQLAQFEEFFSIETDQGEITFPINERAIVMNMFDVHVEEPEQPMERMKLLLANKHLEAASHTWTASNEYTLILKERFFTLSTNEGELHYTIDLLEAILQNFTSILTTNNIREVFPTTTSITMIHSLQLELIEDLAVEQLEGSQN